MMLLSFPQDQLKLNSPNMELRNGVLRIAGGVLVSASQVQLRNLDIKADKGFGVRVAGYNKSAHIISCRVHDCGMACVCVEKGASVAIARCEVITKSFL